MNDLFIVQSKSNLKYLLQIKAQSARSWKHSLIVYNLNKLRIYELKIRERAPREKRSFSKKEPTFNILILSKFFLKMLINILRQANQKASI